MSTITRERAELKAYITGFLTDPAHDNRSASSITAEVFRIALASLEAEPVYHFWNVKTHEWVECDKATHDSFAYSQRRVLYSAPPAPVAMKDHQIRELVNELRDIAVEYHGTQQLRERIALTVRAAMLQSFGNSEQLNSPVIPDCSCRTCRPVTMTDMRFVVCPECGNKRCPHANDHRNACTGSNEPGQEGSAYPAAPQQESR